jgi:2-polyprenyl-3-methyl-5-hydroxy-6-metoxy-1,4-benzoquinol methylase
MYTECRPTTGHIATTPEVWAENFRLSSGYTNRVNLYFKLDSRWGLIKRYVRRGGHVLDAGCGFGEWVEFLNRHGYTAEGLDYSEELVARLRRQYPQRAWTNGTTQAMPYTASSFDALISWGVVEHDPNGPLNQLREFSRVLKSGGKAIITVPYDSEAMRRTSALCFPGMGKFFQFFFTPEELSEMVTQVGFKVLEVGPAREVSSALTFPRLYAKSHGKHPVCRIMGLLFRLAPFIPGPVGMIYVVCERQ